MENEKVLFEQKILKFGDPGANKRIYSEVPTMCFNTTQYENVLIADDPDSILKQFDREK